MVLAGKSRLVSPEEFGKIVVPRQRLMAALFVFRDWLRIRVGESQATASPAASWQRPSRPCLLYQIPLARMPVQGCGHLRIS